MLQPAKQKFRKQHKGRNTGIATTGNKVSFGEFGLKAITRGRITARQIEAASSEGFTSICGRNRAGLAQAMWQLNTSLGARAVHIIEKDYQDGIEPDICIYYHMALSVP